MSASTVFVARLNGCSVFDPAGDRVGKVRDVVLEGGVVEADLVLTDADVELGDLTEARIVTTTLLGRAAVELVPAGDGALEAGDTIPVERTDAPYSITSALNRLTTESGEIDKAAPQRAIDQLSGKSDDDEGNEIGQEFGGHARSSR